MKILSFNDFCNEAYNSMIDADAASHKKQMDDMFDYLNEICNYIKNPQSNDIAKMAFVIGMPGAGKTNTIVRTFEENGLLENNGYVFFDKNTSFKKDIRTVVDANPGQIIIFEDSRVFDNKENLSYLKLYTNETYNPGNDNILLFILNEDENELSNELGSSHWKALSARSMVFSYAAAHKYNM